MRAARIPCLLAAAALLVSGCGIPIDGRPVAEFSDPFKVGGLEAVDGPTGLRPDAKAESREVTDTDGGEIDLLAGQSVSDLEEFWKFAYPDAFGDELVPIKELFSWDSEAYDGTFCDETTEGLVNAGYCELDDTIGWDRTILMPSLRDAYGDMAITMVLAHEYGHTIQEQVPLNPKGIPTLVAEQQADCLSGVYLRWVAEGKSPRFTLNTGEGLNNLLAAMISFRDPLMGGDYYDMGDEHGSAFERISAFQFGFTEGAAACANHAGDQAAPGRTAGGAFQRPDRGIAGHRGVRARSRRRAHHRLRAAQPSGAELRRGVGLDVSRRPAESAGVVLPGPQHHHRRPARTAGDGNPQGGLRGPAATG